MEYLVTFHTHYDAIQYKNFLKQKGISAKLQPVPRKISSSCGVCAVFTLDKAMADIGTFIHEGCAEIFFLKDKIYKLHAEC